jgi:hypothetical protein
MKPRSYVRGLLAGAVSVLALGCGTGIAQANPDPTEPPMPPTLGQYDTVDGPSLFTNPADRGRPSQKNSDGFGMYCQNLWVRCG